MVRAEKTKFDIQKDKYSLFTNDVGTTSIWLNTLRDETGFKVLNEGMPYFYLCMKNSE